MRMVSAGANPVALRRGMMDAVDELVKKLKTIAKPVNGIEDLRDIATVSDKLIFIYIICVELYKLFIVNMCVF